MLFFNSFTIDMLPTLSVMGTVKYSQVTRILTNGMQIFIDVSPQSSTYLEKKYLKLLAVGWFPSLHT
jgi:hypothetical protein